MSKTVSVCLCCHNRPEFLEPTLKCLEETLEGSCEIIIANDKTTDPKTNKLITDFVLRMKTKFFVKSYVTNFGNHAKAQNFTMEKATGDVLVHIEDDILVGRTNGKDVVLAKGWNQIFSKYFETFPEVGQILPAGSGRGEWIPREGYNEFMWGLGALWAITRDVYEKLNTEAGVWDERLCHQIEPDCNLRVRMLGYRLIELKEFGMIHLGEGDQADSFERQAQIIIGVHNMLKKWNNRFVGHWDYDSLFSMSWDDFPPNVNFRRQLAAWFSAEAHKLEDRYKGLGVLKDDTNYSGAVPESIRKKHDDYLSCRLNRKPFTFQFPAHWGKFELINRIRPQGREREDELITLMKNNFVFKGVDRLLKQLQELSERGNFNKSEEDLLQMIVKRPKWNWYSK